MQKEISFYQEMASEHRLQENGRGSVPLSIMNYEFMTMTIDYDKRKNEN